MRLKYEHKNPAGKRWLLERQMSGTSNPESPYHGAVSWTYGSLWKCLYLAATGAEQMPPPFWTFRVECSTRDGRDAYADCSAGLFSRIFFAEILQGRDICTGMFYRWLRLGIPGVGCWRICLQKRFP